MAFIDVLFISCVELIRDVYNRRRKELYYLVTQKGTKSVEKSRELY